jgi:uncharacterized integral membrane protein
MKVVLILLVVMVVVNTAVMHLWVQTPQFFTWHCIVVLLSGVAAGACFAELYSRL